MTAAPAARVFVLIATAIVDARIVTAPRYMEHVSHVAGGGNLRAALAAAREAISTDGETARGNAVRVLRGDARILVLEVRADGVRTHYDTNESGWVRALAA